MAGKKKKSAYVDNNGKENNAPPENVNNQKAPIRAAKNKTAKVSKSKQPVKRKPAPYVIRPSRMTKMDQDPQLSLEYYSLPNIIPIRGSNYNFTKIINKLVTPHPSCCYHVWLDCLFGDISKVTFSDVSAELGTILNDNVKLSHLKINQIYLLAHRSSNQNVSLAGSCFVQFHNSFKGLFKSKPFEDDILMSKIHMVRVDQITLRMHIKTSTVMVFRDGFLNHLAIYDIKALFKFYESYYHWYKAPKITSTSTCNLANSKSDVDGESNQNSSIVPVINLDREVPLLNNFIHPTPNNPANLFQNPMGPASIPQHLIMAASSISVPQFPPQIPTTPVVIDSKASVNPSENTPITKSESIPKGKKDSDVIKRKLEQPKNVMKFNHFEPITKDIIESAMTMISKFESENRYIAFIIDECFTELNIDLIKVKLEPFFGSIKNNCIFIYSNSDRLYSNQEEAMKQTIEPLNRALIVGGKNSREVNRPKEKLTSRNIFSGDVTIESIINLLNKGQALVVKDAFNRTPKTSKKRSIDTSQDLDTENGEPGASKRAIGKPNRMLAAVNNCGPVQSNSAVNSVGSTSAKTVVSKPNGSSKIKMAKSAKLELSDEAFELKLQKTEQTREKMMDTVRDKLQELYKFGDVVIRIDNLPAKLTVHALNLTLGTFSLKADQIIAVKKSKKSKDTMNLRLVMKTGNEDMKKILAKNKWKTIYDDVLLIDKTDLKELESFLKQNHDRIFKLDSSERLPTTHVGYSASG